MSDRTSGTLRGAVTFELPGNGYRKQAWCILLRANPSGGGLYVSIEQVLTLLAETPTRIAAATSGLTEDQLHSSPERGEWSVNEVLAHVRACADVRGEPIRKILAEDHPTFRAVNPRTWIEQTDYLELDFRPSFRAFAKQRADLLAVLNSLRRKDWSRAATVTGAGAALERTVQFYAEWVALHERPHVKQVERIVSTMHPPKRPARGADRAKR